MPKEFDVESRTVERSFFWEEEPTLTCSLCLPQLTGEGPAIRRIQRYYEHLASRLLHHWERRLYPEACAEAEEARRASYPFQPYENRIRFQVTCLRDGLLSLYWDDWLYIGGARGETRRHGDTWDLTSGVPLPMAAFFPPKTKLRQTLVPIAIQQAETNLTAGTSLYYDDYPALIHRHFDKGNFYLTGDTLAFFYPLHSIAPYAEGIPTFTVPLSGGNRET